ncbi:hypothetical protein PRZ48_004844 [Zasmidium cellare]|uniref:Uncharacterized protein n=1 Tax=Zasmidium cellare TaxID=395010 RepID=A0ABR0EQP7_ZASCE|nr:hypothetical protein PRZ48_004844 [Zasmidium cellare]
MQAEALGPFPRTAGMRMSADTIPVRSNGGAKMNERMPPTAMRTEMRKGLVKRQCSNPKRVRWAEDVGCDGVADERGGEMVDMTVERRRKQPRCEEYARTKIVLARKPSPALSVLSPVTGAAHTNTFDLGDHSEAAELSHYITQTLFRHFFESPKERHAWFTVFQEYPILYHAFAHAAGVHADVLNNRIFLSATPSSLAHKGRAMTLLKDALHRLDEANVEVLLIVMVTLATHDLEREGLCGGEMGFVPYAPDAYWMSVYGRLETIGQHLGAIGGLVRLVGGLGRIKLPGLANCLAFDLPEDERALAKDCKEPFYEAARLAAVTYSCAVVYGLPAHRNWHLKRAFELRKVLEGYSSFADEACHLYLWVVCVGALAALRSPNRLFFEEKLGEVVAKYSQLQVFENAAAVLDDFVWSQRACEDGMKGLWRTI